jgi:preprotein translocase subunit SecF
MLLRILPQDTRIPFMRFTRVAGLSSIIAMVASVVLFFAVGLNLGIDFRGGTLIEVQSQTAVADIADIRERVGGLGLGDIEVQEFGTPRDVLIRVQLQPGGEPAQQAAVVEVQNVLADDHDFRRVEMVGPRISGELAMTGTIAVIVTLIGVLFYIWFRFEWQFAVGAILALIHDVILTIGMFTVLQLDFNLASIAAVLTIVGYSLNDTVVIYDRVRENLRRYKQMALHDLLDLSLNQMLSRTILTSFTTLLALFALFAFGGPVIQSFIIALIWGVLVGTYSTVFIAAPVLLYFNLRPAAAPSAAEEPAGA